ncbi:twin-arginine translocase TatA/TatE family subunit [Longivirga aurantiaca]|uniref:Sec-independent protein translocase protein TatA n=1 Tax=Longivirga aurantiaca TaxID=1837743 RepID=A0ABW1T2J6_9ACTN
MAIFEKPAFWIVLLIVLLLFGAKRLPDLARGVGRSLRIFKAETDGLKNDFKSGADDDIAPAAPAVQAAPPAPAAPAVPAAPAQPEAPRYLVDPVTGEQILAQPVTPPADGAPRA